MFDELYHTIKNRYGDGSASQAMGDWIVANTTLNKRRFSFEDYSFQKAIADDMHPDMSVKKCSQVGLALALDTPVPTPNGWTTMGQLAVGDHVFDDQGQPCVMEYVSPIYDDHVCYRVTFDDGETIVADANHKWYVECDRAFNLDGTYCGRGRPPHNAEMFKQGVLDTKTLAQYHQHGERNRFAVPNTKPLDLPEVGLPLDPYYLGVWLGDGNLHASVVTSHQDDAEELVVLLEGRGFEPAISSRKGNTLQLNIRYPDQKRPGRGIPNSPSWVLKQLGLLGIRKFIPLAYLRSSRMQRTELLSGLLDTDGSITRNGRVSFHNTNPDLVAGVEDLAHSLGFKTHTRWRDPEVKPEGATFVSKLRIAEVSFVAYTASNLFCLSRKAGRLRSANTGRPSEALRRRIVNVVSIDPVPVRCISVNSPSHLFLAGRGMIPTHNTEVQIRKFLAMLTRHNGKAGIFSLPNEKMYSRIYSGRIKPIVEADPVFNPEMGTKPTRSRDIVQIRDSFGYITACTEGDATSISADFLMHDEVDLSPQDVLSLYQSRVQNSDLKITQKFSTPTFSAFGIDRAYAMTDQREYVVQCEACNHFQIPRFEPKFIHIDDFHFDIGTFQELASEQIQTLDLESSYVRCEQCLKRLDLGNSERREWVATYPGRTAFRGYQVRPFSTSRLPPSYIFRQLAKNLEENTLRHFYNTVLGEAFADASAQIQRSDVEQCMRQTTPPTIADGTPCFMGIDVGFTCHITISYDDERGLPVFVLFDAVPISQLETRIAELRKIYTIVQGVIDRFPYTTVADTLREATGGLVMPAQYRGNAAVVAQKDELGIITHYSVNNTMLFDRLHSAINNHKMVLSGYSGQRETLIAHLTDMVRDEQPDTESIWKKNSGNDHYFHSMAFNMLARRVCEHYFLNGSSNHVSSAFSGADWLTTGTNLMPGKGAARVSRLGA